MPAGVVAALMIPGLNDSETRAIFEAAARSGACVSGYTLAHLCYEVRGLLAQWLETLVPNRTARVLSLISQRPDGQPDYARFCSRMRGRDPVADLLAARFCVAAHTRV